MAPVTRGFLGAALDRLLAKTSNVGPESCNYAVERLRIPVADNVHLAADLYRPLSTAPPLCTLLVRGPYGIGLPGSLPVARIYAARGYQAVLAWMREQEWYTGSFATLGGSYLGYVQWALLADNPPSDMKAAVISTGLHDFSGLICGTGALNSEIVSWADTNTVLARGGGLLSLWWHLQSQKGRLRPVLDAVPLLDAVDKHFGGKAPEWLRHAVSHPDPTDEFWKPLQLNGALEKANIPILLVTGWYDLLLPQVMEQYSRLAQRGCNVALTIGPWTHITCQQNTIAETSKWLDEHVARGIGSSRPSAVRIFITGAEEWRDLPKWPPQTSPHELFLSPGKTLLTKPQPGAPESVFTFEPANPTPAIGGPQLYATSSPKASRADTALAGRDDVVTFTTAPLSEDVEVCGKPVVTLHHTTDNPHADLLVLLSEVDSSGKSYSISEKYLRLDPNRSQQAALTLELPDCAHRFRKGDRIRLLVAGGSHPRYIRNLGTGEDPGTGLTMRPATHTVRHNAEALSKLVLPVTNA